MSASTCPACREPARPERCPDGCWCDCHESSAASINPVTDELASEFPLLWAAARNADNRERMGLNVGQDDEEAARAMHELWLARTNLRGAS